MSTLTSKTITGISWSFRNQLLIQSANILSGILLMRWLAPTDFGLIAMVLVVSNLIQVFRDAGLSTALIQQKELAHIDLSSTFWFQLMLGLLLGTALLLATPLIHWLYAVENLQYIIFFFGIDIFIGSFSLVPFALLKRNHDFRTIFYVQTFALLISTIVALYLAFTGGGIDSLIAKVLLWTGLNALGVFVFGKWKPQLNFSWSALKKLLQFSTPLMGSQGFNFVVRNVDDFSIGKWIGSEALGFYNRGYKLLLFPVQSISGVLGDVLLSTWSKLQDKKTSIIHSFLNISSAIALVIFPLMTVLIIFTKPIILLVFGEQWLSMAVTVKVLAIIGMLQSVTSLAGKLYLAIGETKLLFKYNLISGIFMALFIIFSSWYFKDISMTATAYGIASLLFLFPYYDWIGKKLGSSFGQMIAPIWKPLGASIIAGIFMYFAYHLNPFELSQHLKLIFSILLGIILYFLILAREVQKKISYLKKLLADRP